MFLLQGLWAALGLCSCVGVVGVFRGLGLRALASGAALGFRD